MADAHPVESHHEESDVNIGAILTFAGGLTAAVIVVGFIVFGFFRYFDAREARQEEPVYPLAATQETRLPPEPRLQTNPREDLADLRADEARTLTSYGWVDRNAGVVRIPIDEAVRLTIERGLPSRSSK